MRVLIFHLTMTICFATSAPGDLPVEVGQYQSALKNFRGGKVTLLELYDVATKAAAVLFLAVEKLSDSDYDMVAHKLEGLIVGREEVIYSSTDPVFFERLAKEKGNAADKDFFKLLKRTKPEGGRWAYFAQITDFQGCYNLDGTMTSLYKEWTAFLKRNPKQYTAQANENIRTIESDILGVSCICGEKDQAVKELQNFLKLDVDSQMKTSAKKRIEDLKSGKGVKFHCSPTA